MAGVRTDTRPVQSTHATFLTSAHLHDLATLRVAGHPRVRQLRVASGDSRAAVRAYARVRQSQCSPCSAGARQICLDILFRPPSLSIRLNMSGRGAMRPAKSKRRQVCSLAARKATFVDERFKEVLYDDVEAEQRAEQDAARHHKMGRYGSWWSKQAAQLVTTVGTSARQLHTDHRVRQQAAASDAAKSRLDSSAADRISNGENEPSLACSSASPQAVPAASPQQLDDVLIAEEDRDAAARVDSPGLFFFAMSETGKIHLAGTHHFSSDPEATYDLAVAASSIVRAGNAAYHTHFVKHGELTSQVEGSHAASKSSAQQAVQVSALSTARAMLQQLTAAVWVEARGKLGEHAKPGERKHLVGQMKAAGALCATQQRSATCIRAASVL